MKRLRHLPTLFLSFVVSLAALPRITTFSGPDTGDSILFILAGILAIHLFALVIGLLLPLAKIWSHLLLITVTLSPIVLLSIQAYQDARYLKHKAVFDRFRDNLVDPIPSTVTGLEFVDLDESKDTHMMFRFQIDPADLQKIIETRGFKRITPDQFRCSVDRFKHPSYLPMDSPASFYVIENNHPEAGGGEGYTLKVNSAMNQVIFRRESAAYYRDRNWGVPSSGR